MQAAPLEAARVLPPTVPDSRASRRPPATAVDRPAAMHVAPTPRDAARGRVVVPAEVTGPVSASAPGPATRRIGVAAIFGFAIGFAATATWLFASREARAPVAQPAKAVAVPPTGQTATTTPANTTDNKPLVPSGTSRDVKGQGSKGTR